MEKSIKCLKEKVSKLRGYAVIIDGEDGEWEPVTTVSVEDIYELIDKLDEPEVKQLDRRIKELESYNDELIRDNNQLRNALDNQEVLSEEFINEKAVEIYADTADAEVHVAFRMRDLQSLLVSKQDEREQLETAYKDILSRREFLFDDKRYVVVEKPTIPEFVAEFLDGKEEYALYELFDGDFIYESHDRLGRWLYDNDEEANRERELSLVLAHIYGYEVETEQRYYVVNNDNRMMLVRMMDGKTITEADPFKLEDMYEGEKKSHRLTEQEIKDYDARYWAFRKQVEELGE